MSDTKLNGKVVHEEAQMSNRDTHVPKEDSQYVECNIGEDDIGYKAALSMYKTLDKRSIALSARKKLERCRKREKTLTKKMQRLFEQYGAEDHPEIVSLSIEIALAKVQYRHDVFSLGLQETGRNMEELGESVYPQLIEQGIIQAELFKDTLHAWINLPELDINDKKVRESYDAAQDFYWRVVGALFYMVDCIESKHHTLEYGERLVRLMDLKDANSVRSQ